MMVLLDWLDHKVAIMNLLHVTDHLSATPQFIQSRMINLVHEKSILLLKVLNLEKHGSTRHLSNHFDAVSGPCAVEFLEDVCSQQPTKPSESPIDVSIGPERVPVVTCEDAAFTPQSPQTFFQLT